MQARCRLYALVEGNPGQIAIVDTKLKSEIARLVLPGVFPSDLELSPDGTTLVVSNGYTGGLAVIDAPGATILGITEPPAGSHWGNDTALVTSSWGYHFVAGGVHKFEIQGGVVSDVPLAGSSLEGLIGTTSDGTSVYVWTGSDLQEYAVRGQTIEYLGQSSYSSYADILVASPQRVFVAPDDAYVYLDGLQAPSNSIEHPTGSVGGQVFAASADASFVVTAGGIYDARLAAPIERFSSDYTTGVRGAALAAADQELWLVTAAGLSYSNVHDHLGAVPLGDRLRPPPTGPLSFSKLLHDPVRQRLLAYTPERTSLVIIDPQTAGRLAELVIGATPDGIAIDPSRDALYVSFTDRRGIARYGLEGPTQEAFIDTERPAHEIRIGPGATMIAFDFDKTWFSVIDRNTGVTIETVGTSAILGATLPASLDSLYVLENDYDTWLRRYSIDTTGVTLQQEAGWSYLYTWGLLCSPDGSLVYARGLIVSAPSLTQV